MKKIALNILLMVVVGILIGWLSMIFLRYWTRHGETVDVPLVKALPYERAITSLSSEGLNAIVSDSVY
ncbi:MAG: PASTA domain-containing protein, partial [Duncaniella sp.]|nr:PASTA domain-containing protein [Duncaniella sp.]